jgi:hypothetical protein
MQTLTGTSTVQAKTKSKKPKKVIKNMSVATGSN